jgi:hypothetical protein
MDCTLDTHGKCRCDECQRRRAEFLAGLLASGKHVAVRVPAKGRKPEEVVVMTVGMARVYCENGASLARLSDGWSDL